MRIDIKFDLIILFLFENSYRLSVKCYYLSLIRLRCWCCCTYVFDCLSFCKFAQPWTPDIRLLPFFAVSKVQRATMVLTFCLAGDTKATVSFPPSPWNTLFLWRKWASGLTKWFSFFHFLNDLYNFVHCSRSFVFCFSLSMISIILSTVLVHYSHWTGRQVMFVEHHNMGALDVF